MYMAAWSGSGDIAKLTTLVTDDVFYEELGSHVVKSGKAELVEYAGIVFAAFQVSWTYQSIIIAEQLDKAALETIVTGIHSGDYLGMPATHKSFSLRVALFLDFKDGKVSRHLEFSNLIDLLQQLGLVPGL